MHYNSARGAVAQVTELLAGVVAAGKWSATNLQANVRLVIAIVEALAAHRVAFVIPAGLLRATDLMACYVTNFRTNNLSASTRTSALSLDLGLTLATGALMTILLTQVRTAFMSLHAKLVAQSQRLRTPLANANKATQTSAG